MAVIDPGNLAPHAMIRARGVVLTRYWRGLWVVQKWPEKRGPPKTWNQFYTSEQFRYAGKMSANPEPMSLATAIFFTAGSHYLPRDVLTMAAYGKFMEVTLPDGTVARQAYHGPPAIEPPAEWLPMASVVYAAQQGFLGGYTIRQLINSSALLNAGLNQCRVTLAAPATGFPVIIDEATIGEGATSGSAYGFDAAPVALTFGGLPGVTIAPGATAISDPVAFAPGAGANLVVAIYESSAPALASNGSQAGWSNAYKAGNDVSSVSVSGYTPWTNASTVQAVETSV